MTVLIDTQILVHAGTQGIEALPPRARKILADPRTERLLSAVSITEVAIKAAIKKLTLTPQLLTELIADLKLKVIPYTSTHAHWMFRLPLHHKEPFDRMIISVALAENVPLMGADARFPLYRSEGLSVIWN